MPDDSSETSHAPLRYSVKGKRMKFFDAQGVDELVSICMGLAQEMWVIKERQVVLESLAAKKGVTLPDDIEEYEFSNEERAQLDSEKHGFIDRIFFTLREEAEALATEPEDEPPAPTLP